MLVTEITTHVQDALGRLLQQYQGKPGIAALLSAIVEQIQQLENGMFPIDQGRQIFNGSAVGAQLDGLGQLIGLSRNGLTDAQYLVLLLGTIAEDNSDTTAETLLNIVQTVFEATNVFIKDSNSPGSYPLSLDSPATVAFGVGSPQIDPSLYPIVERIIQNSVGAGIAVYYLSSFDAANAFAMAGPQPWVKGFADLNVPGSGGKFASLVFNNPTQ